MATIPNSAAAFRHTTVAVSIPPRRTIRASSSLPRRQLITGLMAVSLTATCPLANAQQSWGTRSLIWDTFIAPKLSPEEASDRIHQTAAGLHELRSMLEAKAWKYVLVYIRLKQKYLDKDMKNAMKLVPEARRKAYVETANRVVDNMDELDYYVRNPKIYESYVYYEKMLKSIDELAAFLV